METMTLNGRIVSLLQQSRDGLLADHELAGELMIIAHGLHSQCECPTCLLFIKLDKELSPKQLADLVRFNVQYCTPFYNNGAIDFNVGES